jgi:hypothetical protein
MLAHDNCRVQESVWKLTGNFTGNFRFTLQPHSSTFVFSDTYLRVITGNTTPNRELTGNLASVMMQSAESQCLFINTLLLPHT